MVGRTLSHYRIVEQLGAGGMGVVYKAEDTRLGRPVALKFLPEHLACDRAALERFHREARAASALNHPNICTIHDVDEAEGRPFIAMELLEGEPLRVRLSQGRAAIPAIVDLGIQLADALEAAHAKGIVHRDIKPENIFITMRGTAKLLDFGIAKLMTEQAAATATMTASRVGTGPVALGTVAYMSPEQVRGEPLDARTDLFSLGVVLYEMATATQPFRGTTSGAVLGEILMNAPIAPVRLNPDVPLELERIGNKLLEKDRELRYQSARDVRVDLERLRRTLAVAVTGGRRPAVEQASIVVLPFENLSSDPEQEYFCDGMTDEIITTLSKMSGLRVISRNSAMALKGARKSARETSALLNVGHVLQGSVRKAGNSVRINAQLVDTATDGHIWAERYSGTLDEVFEIQEKVAARIGEALKVRLGPAQRGDVRPRSIADDRAQECYRRAWHEMFAAAPPSFDRAVQMIGQGMESIGEHPILQVAMAEVHYLAVEWGFEPRDRLLGVAVDFTRRIQASDPDRAAALMGKLERFTGSQERAIRHFEDAVDRDPADTVSLWFLSHSYSIHAGKPLAGIAVADRLVSIDPLTALNRIDYVIARWTQSDFAGALAALDDVHRREPNHLLVRGFRPQMLASAGQVDEACQIADAEFARDPGNGWAVLWKGPAHALRREREALVALVEGPAHDLLWTDPEGPWWAAGWLAMAGERERALDWLEHWVDRGSFNYPMVAGGEPLLENLRGESRFHHLLDRIRPVWERFVPRFNAPGDI